MRIKLSQDISTSTAYLQHEVFDTMARTISTHKTYLPCNMDIIETPSIVVLCTYHVLEESDEDFFMIPFFTMFEFFVIVLTCMEACPVNDPLVVGTTSEDLDLVLCFFTCLENVIIRLD